MKAINPITDYKTFQQHKDFFINQSKLYSRDLFDKFEHVNKTKQYNMVFESNEAVYASQLTHAEYQFVLMNYNELNKRFNSISKNP